MRCRECNIDNYCLHDRRVSILLHNSTCTSLCKKHWFGYKCKQSFPFYFFSKISTHLKPYIIFLKTNANFQYIDLWSSRWTWGGNPPPGEGEVAVISRGQTVYFDAHTPVLKGVLIVGGSLIFDDSQDVHLQAEYIIIVYAPFLKDLNYFKFLSMKLIFK